MAKLFKKKHNEEQKTRVEKNIQIDKNYYDTPIIIKDNIDPNKRNIFIKLLNSKYTNLVFIIIASILVGILVFYFFNYDSFNKNVEVVHSNADKNYVFLGDSLTERCDFDKYYPNLKNRIVNSGVNGNTTNNILDNMYRRVYRYNPTDVFILIGTNDIGKKYELQKIFDNYVSIVSQIQKNRPLATIRIVSIYPVNYKLRPNEEKIKKMTSINNLNEALKIYCRNNNIEYIDMYSKLLDKDGFLDKKYTGDGLHLNDEGYKVVTREFKKYLEE